MGGRVLSAHPLTLSPTPHLPPLPGTGWRQRHQPGAVTQQLHGKCGGVSAFCARPHQDVHGAEVGRGGGSVTS